MVKVTIQNANIRGPFLYIEDEHRNTFKFNNQLSTAIHSFNCTLFKLSKKVENAPFYDNVIIDIRVDENNVITQIHEHINVYEFCKENYHTNNLENAEKYKQMLSSFRSFAASVVCILQFPYYLAEVSEFTDFSGVKLHSRYQTAYARYFSGYKQDSGTMYACNQEFTIIKRAQHVRQG